MSSSAGGLQRRRAGGAASTSASASSAPTNGRGDDDEDGYGYGASSNGGSGRNSHRNSYLAEAGPSSTSSPSMSRAASSAAAAATTAGSGVGGNTSGARSVTLTTQSGHRIAYDPRDLDDEGEAKENPRLTLMEETLLLGLKDRQGYLSFWNDNISYALRGCILIELALRKRIAIVRSGPGRVGAIQDRLVEVVDSRMTGEVLLDEALKLIKATEEKMSASQWVDLLSGETWNVTKIGYQLKQVRERLAKGLVDKGILRTEKRNFLLFDMATHPIADAAAKDAVLRRVLTLLTSASQSVHVGTLYREERKPVALAATRALCLICSAFSANVLENALNHLSYDQREAAFQKADDMLTEAASWPMFPRTGVPVGGNAVATSFSSAGSGSSRSGGVGGIGEGSVAQTEGFLSEPVAMGASLTELAKAVRSDLERDRGAEAHFECVAAVLNVLSRMDSLL